MINQILVTMTFQCLGICFLHQDMFLDHNNFVESNELFDNNETESDEKDQNAQLFSYNV